MIDWNKVEEMVEEVRQNKCNKNIHETKDFKITVYRCGNVIRVDFKEKV